MGSPVMSPHELTMKRYEVGRSIIWLRAVAAGCLAPPEPLPRQVRRRKLRMSLPAPER